MAAPALAAILAAPFAVSAGCAAPGGGADYGVSAVQFQDIVVPDGMNLLHDFHESHSREGAGWRYGDFRYSGGPTVDEACSYLLQRMPQHRWQLTQDEPVGENSRRLRFERGRYRADYTLERVDGVTRMQIEYRTEIK